MVFCYTALCLRLRSKKAVWWEKLLLVALGGLVGHEYYLSENGQPFVKAGETREQFTAELGQTILASSLTQQPCQLPTL